MKDSQLDDDDRRGIKYIKVNNERFSTVAGALVISS